MFAEYFHIVLERCLDLYSIWERRVQRRDRALRWGKNLTQALYVAVDLPPSPYSSKLFATVARLILISPKTWRFDLHIIPSENLLVVPYRFYEGVRFLFLFYSTRQPFNSPQQCAPFFLLLLTLSPADKQISTYLTSITPSVYCKQPLQ